MCGRAGRPQFDTAGVAVIMTQRHTRAAYEGLVHGTKPIESNLGLAMPEHVNAEIASGIITDKETAMDWLKHSFFYIRVTQNPRHYGVVAGKTPDVACGEMVAENLRKISSAQMCEIGEDPALPRGNFIKPLEGGRVMSDMYIRFETMKRIMSVQSPASVPDLLMTLCESDELSSIKLRRDEKVLLKGWNLSKDEPAIVRFKVTEIRGKAGKVAVAKTVKTAAQKIYIIAQETMSDQFATVLPPSMRMEVENVFQNGRRIMQGAARYFANVSKEGNFAAYCNALRLAKALYMRMWVRTSSSSIPRVVRTHNPRFQDDTIYPMRQIPKCGKKSVQALAEAGLRSLDQVLAQDPRALERVVNKAFPHGNHLHDAIRSLPCAMALHIERANDARGGVVNVEVTFSASAPPSDEAEAGVTESSRRWTAHLIVGTTWNDELLHNERIVQRGPGPDNVEAGVPVTRSVALPSAPPAGQEVTIVATLMFDKCVGRDADAVLRVRAAGFVGGGGTPIGRRVGAIGGNAANVVSPSGRHRVAAGKENNLSPAFCRLMAAPPAAPKPVPRAIWTEPLISETATLGVGSGRSHAPPPFDAFEDVTEWNPSGTLRPAPVDADDGWGGSGDDDSDRPGRKSLVGRSRRAQRPAADARPAAARDRDR
jgi:ATP-dependent DNA helicase HFM1/MER3